MGTPSRRPSARQSTAGNGGRRSRPSSARSGRPRSRPDRDDTDPDEPLSLGDRFRAVADGVTRVVGTPWAMGGAVLIVAGWALSGPIFDFSDTWQLIINTGTTIVTFLMVFAIQTSQNRESRAMHLKLDELLRATTGTRKRLIEEEHASQANVERDEREFEREARPKRRKG